MDSLNFNYLSSNRDNHNSNIINRRYHTNRNNTNMKDDGERNKKDERNNEDERKKENKGNKEDEINKKNTKKLYKEDVTDKLVRFSFYITYAFLMTTATVTFIEAIKTKNNLIRHILNLETCISIVAAFFYGMFMKKINVETINYKEINVNRYVDWAITTPIMLWVLILAFCYNNKMKLTLKSYLIILLLNYGMLSFGFMGENNILNKLLCNFIGFIFFAGLYGYIFIKYIKKFNIFDNNILYLSFLILWSLYGVAYWFKEKEKNVTYNVLDLFSKCFVGIFFWAYFTGTIILSNK